MGPAVEIEVDTHTGVWTTDGLPMVYIPRHFMLGIHDSVEVALGRDRYRAVLSKSGAGSAYFWCKQQAEARQLDGVEVFKHYLARLSTRGWGQFDLEDADFVSGTATITLVNSIYVLGRSTSAEHPVCYMFEGFIVGGLTYLAEDKGMNFSSITCQEVQCQALEHDVCRFEATLAP
jgi:predicted hydrocarbon binding protein